MKKIKIDNTDIFLEDHGGGKGKITVSNSYEGAFTYYWGAMGSSLNQFLCDINPDYFATKLCTEMNAFDGKGSARNVRKFIKEESGLNWFDFMEEQREMREKINELESCSNDNEFVDMCIAIPGNFIDDDFKEILNGIFKNEPWHFISHDRSTQYKWLYNLHGKLKKEIKSQLVPA